MEEGGEEEARKKEEEQQEGEDEEAWACRLVNLRQQPRRRRPPLVLDTNSLWVPPGPLRVLPEFGGALEAYFGAPVRPLICAAVRWEGQRARQHSTAQQSRAQWKGRRKRKGVQTDRSRTRRPHTSQGSTRPYCLD